MWLTYLDESGNTGNRLDDPDQPFHIIAGVSVPVEMVNDMSRHLDDVVGSRLGTTARTRDTELHANELKHGRGAWKGRGPSERIEVFREALEPLSWDGVFVALAGIDKRRYANRKDQRSPHLWALQFLIEKLNRYFKYDQRGLTLLVADETHEHEQYALDLLVDMQAGNPTRGLNLGEIDRIVDTVHFVRSETNRGVQLADLVAYLDARITNPGADSTVELQIWQDCVVPHIRTYRAPWPAQ